MKTYKIKKGKHSANGFHFGLTFNNKIKFRARFSPNCLYDHGTNDNYDVNKLYGFSTTWFHHKQSARVGWRCINLFEIEIVTYSYNNSKRSIDELDVLGSVRPNEWFECEIVDMEDSYLYTFRKDSDGDRFNKRQVKTAKDKKEKDWFLFHYILFPYFGGNLPAPHDMEITIQKK